MKDYSKMSDFELNVQVAEKECVNWYCSASNSPSGGWEYCSVDELMLKDDAPLKDYCNNPSDAWPLIESNLICLVADVFCEPQDGGKWIAQPAYGWQHERVRNDNPLRAAMIMYLMMKDEEK